MKSSNINKNGLLKKSRGPKKKENYGSLTFKDKPKSIVSVKAAE